MSIEVRTLCAKRACRVCRVCRVSGGVRTGVAGSLVGQEGFVFDGHSVLVEEHVQHAIAHRRVSVPGAVGGDEGVAVQVGREARAIGLIGDWRWGERLVRT